MNNGLPFEVPALLRMITVVDIESLSTAPNAKIASIGAVGVDLQELTITDRFYCRIEHHLQQRAMDMPTLQFWKEQQITNPVAYAEIYSEDGRLSLREGLTSLNDFIASVDASYTHADEKRRPQLMGNGSEFDNVVLANAFNQKGIEMAWDFGCNQSLRTAMLFSRLKGINPKSEVEFIGVQHHALHDAEHEAKLLIHALKAIFCDTKQ